MSTIAENGVSLAHLQWRQILGLRFFTGNASQAVERMMNGGLLVVPAAPALKDLPSKPDYREALLNADVTLTDSGFMVLLWNFLERDNVPKVSGLAYMREFLELKEIQRPGHTFWVMPSNKSSDRNRAWLKSKGIRVEDEDVYVAPIYEGEIRDVELLNRLRTRRPPHIVVTLGGGTQERLGLYLKRNLDFYPAIHCLGAAIAFLSGDQVRIPVWADALCLGWLFRCISEPKRNVARYWSARKLVPLMLRYRDQLPVAEACDAAEK